MKRLTQLMLGACLAVAATACGSGPEEAPSTPPPAVGTAGAAVEPGKDPSRTPVPAPRSSDAEFVSEMMADSQSEIELAKLAQQKARSKQVKDFAAQMVRDHTRAYTELKTLGTTANLDMPKAPAADHDPALKNRLSGLSGAEFDRAYMEAMVDDHDKAVKEAEERAEDAQNDHVKQWAAKALPTLKKHLDAARQIHEGLEKAGN